MKNCLNCVLIISDYDLGQVAVLQLNFQLLSLFNTILGKFLVHTERCRFRGWWRRTWINKPLRAARRSRHWSSSKVHRFKIFALQRFQVRCSITRRDTCKRTWIIHQQSKTNKHTELAVYLRTCELFSFQ